MRTRFPIGIAFVLAVALPAAVTAQPVATSTAPAGSTVINLNELATSTAIQNQYQGLGLTISGGLCANSWYSANLFGGDLMQATNFTNGQFCPPGSSSPYPAITFTFSSPIDMFGVLGGANGASSGLLFTTSGGSVQFSTLMPNVTFQAITDPNGFSQVTLSAGGNGAFTLDNITFRPMAAVPEPTTLGLCGIGAVLLLSLRLRQAPRRTQ